MQEIKRLNLAVEFWGYGSISAQFCEDHKIDLQAHAANQGWFLILGKICHTLAKLPPEKSTAYEDIIHLPVGETKKAIKQKLKEIKKQAKKLPPALKFK